jgi:hypothetical protein
MTSENDVDVQGGGCKSAAVTSLPFPRERSSTPRGPLSLLPVMSGVRLWSSDVNPALEVSGKNRCDVLVECRLFIRK